MLMQPFTERTQEGNHQVTPTAWKPRKAVYSLCRGWMERRQDAAAIENCPVWTALPGGLGIAMELESRRGRSVLSVDLPSRVALGPS